MWLLYTHTSYCLSLKLTTLLMYFIKRLKGGFEGTGHWIFKLMYVNVHNLTCNSIGGHANIYKCMGDDTPLICFGHCIFASENYQCSVFDCWCQVSVTTW